MGFNSGFKGLNYDVIKGRLNSQTCKEFLTDNAEGTES